MNDAPDFTTPPASGAPAMSRDVAHLIVELVNMLRAAHDEVDESRADAAAVREQRNVVLQQLHEAYREIKRKNERIATLCDENRRLLTQVREWTRVAA